MEAELQIKEKMEEFVRRIKKDSEGPEFGALKNRIEVWYNEVGDCLQLKTMNIATIAKRIDEFLTIYYSVEKRDLPVGFQLKDVKVLINKFELKSVAVGAGYSKEGNALKSISLVIELILKAYEKSRQTGTIGSRNGYRTAFEILINNKIAGLAGV
jgi:hypothetical protein